MTISTTTDQATFTADGTSTTFPFSYPFFSPSDVQVSLVNTSTGVATLSTLNGGDEYDYTLSGTQDAASGEYLSGASVIFNTAPPSGNVVALQRAVPATQGTVFNNNTLFPAKAVEAALDRLTMLIQQAMDTGRLAISVPAFDTAIGSLTLPAATQRANLVLSFNSVGAPVLLAMGDQSAQTVTAIGGTVPASLAQRFSRQLNVTDDFGAVGNGVTDDSAAIQAAINAVAAAGGGALHLAPLNYYSASGFTVASNVDLVGMQGQPGEPSNSNYATQPFTIRLNPAATITLEERASIQGVFIISSAYFVPQSYRDCITLISSYAGTAITINGTETKIARVFIGGFNQAIYSTNQARHHIDDVNIDCTYGIIIDNSHDTSRIGSVHCWTFLTFPFTNNVPSVAVAGIINNGNGLMRVETETAHGLITGDVVTLTGVVGTGYGLQGPTQPNSRWTVTVITATQFDLTLNGANQASSYAGTTYESAGTVYLIGGYRKSGQAFAFTNSEFIACDKLVSFGYDVGVYFGAGASWVDIGNLGVDNYLTAGDPYTTGVYFDSTSSACSISGGLISSQAIAIKNTSSGSQVAHMMTGVAFGKNNNPTQPYLVWQYSGRLLLSGCTCDNIAGGQALIRVEDTSTCFLLTGCDINGVPFQFASVQGAGQNSTIVSGCSGSSQVLIGVDGGNSGSFGLLGATNYAHSKAIEFIGEAGAVTQVNVYENGSIIATFATTGLFIFGGLTAELPTADPRANNALWNNAGVVNISNGT